MHTLFFIILIKMYASRHLTEFNPPLKMAPWAQKTVQPQSVALTLEAAYYI